MSKPTIATRAICCFVRPREVPAGLELDRSNRLILRLDAAHPCRRGVVRALYSHRSPFELGADDGNHRRLGGERAGVLERQDDLSSGPFAAGLQARPPAPDDRDVLAELEQHLVVAAPKPFASGREDDHRNHPPQNPEHGQEAAQLVGAQILERLDEGFPHVAQDGRMTLSPSLTPSSTWIFVPLPTPSVTGFFLRPVLVPGATTSTKACFCAS